MSKAFTKETEAAEPGASGPLSKGFKNYVTPNGLRLLRDELDSLRRVERPKVVEVVAWAAGNGDRSENGDYIYGKKRLREIDLCAVLRLHALCSARQELSVQEAASLLSRGPAVDSTFDYPRAKTLISLVSLDVRSECLSRQAALRSLIDQIIRTIRPPWLSAIGWPLAGQGDDRALLLGRDATGRTAARSIA